MVTKAEIEEGLATYVDEMHRCATAQCNFALAHLLLIIPGGLDQERSCGTIASRSVLPIPLT